MPCVTLGQLHCLAGVRLPCGTVPVLLSKAAFRSGRTRLGEAPSCPWERCSLCAVASDQEALAEVVRRAAAAPPKCPLRLGLLESGGRRQRRRGAGGPGAWGTRGVGGPGRGGPGARGARGVGDPGRGGARGAEPGGRRFLQGLHCHLLIDPAGRGISRREERPAPPSASSGLGF